MVAATEQKALQSPPGVTRPRRRRLSSYIMHVLCVLPVALVVIFWARSYLPGELRVMSESGRLFLFFTEADATGYVFPPNGRGPGAARAWSALEIAPRQAEVWRMEALGVRIAGHDTRSAFGFVLVSIPYPYVLLLALPPLWWLYRYRRRRARADGAACDRCGYDLTGNVSGVCPECGERRGRVTA